MKWSRGKDRYIGRLYSDIIKVPSDSGIFQSTGEIREYGKEVLGLMDQVVEERRQGKAGRAAPLSFLSSLSFLLPSFPLVDSY